MKPYILAIDVGTSGAKLLLLHSESGQSYTHSESYPTHTPRPGWAQQDPRDWYRAVSNGIPALLKEAGVSSEQIGAIGIDGISWTPICLNSSGEVLCQAPIWNDTRSAEECLLLDEKIGADTSYHLSGNPNQPYYILPKVHWLLRNKAFSRSELSCILSCNGYLVYRLTGMKTHDLCQAYGWCFFDMEKGIWDQETAERADFDLSWLPSLYECTSPVGTVSEKAAAECGLCKGIPVVAGGLDAACGATGAGVTIPGITHEQSGSAGGMSICMESYQPARGLILSRHIVPGQYLLQGGTVGGGGLIRWLQQVLGGSLDELLSLAQASPAGSNGLLFLPYMAGERSPIWNPHAKGVFEGLSFSTNRGDIVRSVLEGAAYALNHNLETARSAGSSVGLMRAVGGASRSSLWMQIKADITGESICPVASGETTAIGCAMMAGVGCGLYRDFSQAENLLTSIGEAYHPDTRNQEIYQEGYQRYLGLYESLKARM